MRYVNTFLFLCFLTTFASCNSPGSAESALSAGEIHYCDSFHFDRSILTDLKSHTQATLEPFHYSLSRQLFADGTEKESDPIFLPGFVFKETTERTEQLLTELQEDFKIKGYSLFIVDRNYGYGGKPDVMAVLKTIDKYEILREIRTDGANYDIDPDSLVKIIKVFDDKYALDLRGASGDWCEFRIMKAPSDWMVLAKEAYAVCPDIVDQGTGTVEALADELRKTGILYFWWD